MNLKTIQDAFEYTLRLPQNEQEAFASFCALNVISVATKRKLVSNKKGYGVLKTHVTKIANYCLRNPDLKIIDNIYIDTSCKPNLIIFVCMGVQFSFHNIFIDNTLSDYSTSSKNQVIVFDGIRKQPIAEGMFNLGKMVEANKISDRKWISNEVLQLSQKQ